MPYVFILFVFLGLVLKTNPVFLTCSYNNACPEQTNFSRPQVFPYHFPIDCLILLENNYLSSCLCRHAVSQVERDLLAKGQYSGLMEHQKMVNDQQDAKVFKLNEWMNDIVFVKSK